jgi:aminomethyltransferase
MQTPKKTALYDHHVSHGGKIIDFAGWALPVQYEGITEEHEAVRNNVGLFDVSHMGEFTVKGKDAQKFVQYLVTNDVEAMRDNQVIYSMMCYEHGGIVDDLLVYRIAMDDYYLVVNASNVDKDFAWVMENSKGFDVQIENISENISEIALQGPMAQKTLQKITDFDLNEIGFFELRKDLNVSGINCLVSRTGYTGEDGFEIYTENESVGKLFDLLVEAGKEFDLKLCGLGCRDTLRFEATLPLYGQEIDKDITPLEAGLGIFVKLATDFIGKEALVKQKEEGLKRKVVGFELLGKGIPRHGYEVYAGEELIGVVTTGYKAITVPKTIGLALVDAKYSNLGDNFNVKIRNNSVQAVVISKKFIDKNYKK